MPKSTHRKHKEDSMKNWFVRIVSGVGIVVCISFFILNGCAKQEEKVVIWHWMTDRQPAFLELARRYETKTGMKINFELYAPSDAYSQKVRAAAQGQTLPDIFGILGEKRDFASFAKAGYVLDLTPYMEENKSSWRKQFFTQALAGNEFGDGNTYGAKPGIYGVPIDIMTIEMVYNKTLLKDLGFDPEHPPQTFDEFIDIGKKIKGTGLQGLVSGWVDVWMASCLANNFAFNIMGEEKVLATIRGEVPYTDPDWVRVLDLFQQMKASGLLTDEVVAMINKTAEQLFANDKAVFAFNGSWCVNVYKTMNPDLDYAVMLPPRVSNKFPVSVWGGAGSSFMVNATSKKKSAAVKFLQWLTDVDQQAYLAGVTNNLPANKHSLGDVPAVLADFSRAMEYSTHPSIWDVAEFPAVNEAMGRGIQSIILGKKTPAQVAAAVQRIKERETARKR